MRERLLRILGLLKSTGAIGLKDFREEDATSFEIKTAYAGDDHRTWLKYELNNDGSAVRMELTHLFGYLDFEPGVGPRDLLELMSMNLPSFQNSSAYLGTRQHEGTVFVSLNSTIIYLTKWSDEDIADALSIHLFDLTMGLVFVPPLPIKQFGAE